MGPRVPRAAFWVSSFADAPGDVATRVSWWQTSLWQYAVFAVVIYSRAAAERLTGPLEVIARRIAARHHLDLPNDG
jgi:hypothetical protein